MKPASCICLSTYLSGAVAFQVGGLANRGWIGQHIAPSTCRVRSTSRLQATSTEEEQVTASAGDAAAASEDENGFPIVDAEDDDEIGLKVTPWAWKWPETWPYTDDYFERDLPDNDGEFYETARMDKIVKDAALEKLQEHYSRHIFDGDSLLEIGASANSYLPPDLKLSRVAGVGMNQEEMSANPALSESTVVDLNAEGKLPFDDDTFDKVMIPNSIEFFSDPRIILKEAYRVLKPEGVCMIPFVSKGSYDDYIPKQVSMWKTMNDAQHMWIIGSFYRFSCGDGWLDLKGYDLTPPFTKNALGMANQPDQIAYVVQATKAPPPDDSDVEGQMKLFLRGFSSLDTSDTDLVALRLSSEYAEAKDEAGKAAVQAALRVIPGIYNILAEIDSAVLFPPLKALLATRLVMNGYNGNDLHVKTLKQGLGLAKPESDLWKPLGLGTTELNPEDRSILLSDIVPCFGNPEKEEALDQVKEVFPQILEIIKKKCPRMKTEDQQILGSDLLLTDFLLAEAEIRDGMVEWLEGVEGSVMEGWMEERASYKEKRESEIIDSSRRSEAV
ncbi:unnamed protein product [Chrysoparadoxa australica]